MTNGIRYISAHGHSGYGTAARRLLLGLNAAGIPFTWTPMVNGRSWDLWFEPLQKGSTKDPALDSFCGRDIPYDTVVLHLVPEYALRWRQMEPDKRFILHTTWETDRIPHHWRFFLELADVVIVPSTWNKHIFERAGLRVPVEVLPHIAIDPNPPQGPPPVPIRNDDFVFLTVDSWTPRKGLRNLIKCYLDTFTAADSVTLVVKTGARSYSTKSAWTHSASTVAETRAIQGEYRNPARLILLTQDLSESDLLRLHARADCYVSLSHGEGWGIGAFDAATYGKPVIATAFGGSLDYLHPDAACLVRCRMVPVNDDQGKPSFSPDQKWAEPDLVHAGRLMRHVVANRDEAAVRGLQLQSNILKRFNEHAMVARFMQILNSDVGHRHAEAAAP